MEHKIILLIIGLVFFVLGLVILFVPFYGTVFPLAEGFGTLKSVAGFYADCHNQYYLQFIGGNTVSCTLNTIWFYIGLMTIAISFILGGLWVYILSSPYLAKKRKEREAQKQQIKLRKQANEKLRLQLEEQTKSKTECVYLKKGVTDEIIGVGLQRHLVKMIPDEIYKEIEKPVIEKRVITPLTSETLTDFSVEELKLMKSKLDIVADKLPLHQRLILSKVKKVLENPDAFLQESEEPKVVQTDNKSPKVSIEQRKEETSAGGVVLFLFTIFITILIFVIFTSVMNPFAFIPFVGEMSFSVAFIIFILLNIYFIPSYVAFNRVHPSRIGIFVLNVLLGGTGIFWVIALVWSLSDAR